MDRYRKEFWQKDLSDVAFFRTVACVIWASLGATAPVRFFTRRRIIVIIILTRKREKVLRAKFKLLFPKRGEESAFPLFIDIIVSLSDSFSLSFSLCDCGINEQQQRRYRCLLFTSFCSWCAALRSQLLRERLRVFSSFWCRFRWSRREAGGRRRAATTAGEHRRRRRRRRRAAGSFSSREIY